MAKINRSKLNKIIQEEVKKAIIEEGFFDDLGVIGKDIGKYMKTVRHRGAEAAAGKAREQVKREQVAALRKQLQILNKEFARSQNPALQDEIGTVEAALAALEQGGSAGEAVVQSLAAAADPETPAPEVSPGRAEVERVLAKHAAIKAAEAKKETGVAASGEKGAEGAEGGAEATKLSTGDKIIDDPQKTAQIVIAAIKRAGAKKWPTLFTGKDPKFDAHFLTVLKGVMRLAATGDKTGKIFGAAKAAPEAEQKAVAENKQSKLQISKTTLQEAIRIIRKNGL